MQTTTCRCTPETRPAELQLIRGKKGPRLKKKEENNNDNKRQNTQNGPEANGKSKQVERFTTG